MNVILGRLESAGLVVRSPHPGHGLILLVELTAAGRKMVDQGSSASRRQVLVELLTSVGERLARVPSPGR